MRSKDPRRFPPLVAASLVALAAFVFPFASARALCRPESLLVVHASLRTSFLPRSIVVGDFNGDGILDLVTATSHLNPPDQDAVAVLLGNGANRAGDGTFRAPVFYAVGRSPLAVAAADFDGDHILDLAVLNRIPGSVSILRGLGSGGVGDGTFAPLATLDTGPDPIDLVAGDFRKDGFADLAVLHSLFGIRVIAGSASGAFTVAQNLPMAGTSTGNLVAADLNRDGILDLAFGRTGPSIGVAYGRGAARSGDGSFTAPIIIGGGGAFDVADMNRDGLPDLVIGGGGALSIALGAAAGGFGAPAAVFPAYPAGAVRVADVDGDGFNDIIAGAYGGIAVLNALGASGSSYRSFAAPEPISPGLTALCIATGDFDADGRIDVAAGRIDEVANTARLDVLLGHCGDSPAPILDAVADMPNDQGGRLRLSWRRSAEDGLAGNAVTSYAVYRRDPGVDSWQVAGSVPATKLNSYGFIANAVQDSAPAGAPATSFYVSALTGDASVHYDSAVLSGYSTDNIAPPMPGDFTGALATGEGVGLSWSPVTAPDLLRYRIHRVELTTLPPAPPDDHNLIATPAEAGFLDRDATSPSGVLHYWIAAEDLHGNVGPYSRLQLFTSDCIRGVNQIMNNTSELTASARPARDGPLAAGEQGPPVKKPTVPPPPFVTSYGASLDTVIHDDYGVGRARYDLRSGELHAEAAAAGHAKSVEVIATDSYRVQGLAPRMPPALTIEIELKGLRLDHCATPPCAGGAVEAAIQAGGGRVEATLYLGAGGGAARDTTLTLLVPIAADGSFSLYADLLTAAAVDGAVSADGWIRFSGLPDGAVVTSCAGYAPGARMDRRVTRAPAGRGPTALRGVPGATGPDELGSDAAARSSFAPPSIDASGRLHITFSLASDRPASLQVFDLAGRRLVRLNVGDFGPGEHRLDVAEASRWPAGLYFASVVQGDRSITRRFAIVH
jgi:hypothetical protein